ncbi:response regulator transcription factor [Rhizobium panacihumi]|uniref:response regulator transcription factor n=1 Tax=Rhizobium panacihumi TaxID=2008450 RepID=UPI003D796B6F
MFSIAIVEDEELERRALRTIIERNVEGICIVGEAKNGSEAVRLLDEERIDLMLLDIKIPRPHGLEILQMIRERHLTTKVLILTAYDYFEIMQKAIELKADGFLLKPVRTEALLKAVGDCLAEPFAAAPGRSAVVEVEDIDADDIQGRLGDLVDRRAYRDCLRLVRRRLETIYAHRDTAPRHEVLDLAEMLTDLVALSGRELPQAIARQIDGLESQRLDARSLYKVQELFCQITDTLFEADDERTVPAGERIETVLHFIERNLAKGVTLEDAAEFAHVSPCYLSRLFRKEMNMTFISYLKEQRIERAKDLLQNSDLPITNVSLDLSYADANYFCKAFKKEVGISPSEYRRRFQTSAGGSAAQNPATVHAAA